MSARYLVIGQPIAHSLSPVMHRAALDALGIDARYDAREVAPHELAALVDELRSGALAGVNVTLPHKLEVARCCDRLEGDAIALSAVNTLVREGGAVVGANTDAEGLLAALAPHAARVRGARVVLLGAGGAARAALAVAHRLGAGEVVVAAREEARARALGATAISLHDGDALARAFEQTALLIQATSATLHDEDGAFARALPLDRLPAGAVVVDLVYRPLRTSVLRAAEARGLATESGVEMLVQQGAASLARWLGRAREAMPIDRMREAVLRAL